jgi:hypothetical protein
MAEMMAGKHDYIKLCFARAGAIENADALSAATYTHAGVGEIGIVLRRLDQ